MYTASSSAIFYPRKLESFQLSVGANEAYDISLSLSPPHVAKPSTKWL